MSLRERLAEDVAKPKYSQLEWSRVRMSIAENLNKKLKEPKRLLFFVGAIFECTFNDANSQFTQSQMALLFELPSKETLDRWEKMKVLVAPPGMKEINFDENLTKEDYLTKKRFHGSKNRNST